MQSINYKPSAKEVISEFFRIIGEQNKEPLTAESLYLIHTTKLYQKPYDERVKGNIDSFKEYILKLISEFKLNEGNLLNRKYIDWLVCHFKKTEVLSLIDEHEFLIAFTDLVEENEQVYNLCCKALHIRNEGNE